MPTTTEKIRTLTEEVAYRKGFVDGARAALAYIPRFLDRGLPLIDAMDILARWVDKLDIWAQCAVTDGDGDSAPPKP